MNIPGVSTAKDFISSGGGGSQGADFFSSSGGTLSSVKQQWVPVPITGFYPLPNTTKEFEVTGTNLQKIAQIGFELQDRTILFINPKYLTMYTANNTGIIADRIDIFNTPFYLPFPKDSPQTVHLIYNTDPIPAANAYQAISIGNTCMTNWIQPYTNTSIPSDISFITSANKNQYDWKGYYSSYPDLNKNGITGQNMAISHWNNAGIYEVRTFPKFAPGRELIDSTSKNLYDWKKYVNDNKLDTGKNGWGRSQDSAIEHWNTYGIWENRPNFPKFSGGREFIDSSNIDQYDWKSYLAKYPEILTYPSAKNPMYTNSQVDAIKQWNNSGIYNGWVFPKFNTGRELIDSSNKNQYNWKQYLTDYPQILTYPTATNPMYTNSQDGAIKQWNDSGAFIGWTFPKFPPGVELIDNSNIWQYDWSKYLNTYPQILTYPTATNPMYHINQADAVKQWNDSGIFIGWIFPKYDTISPTPN